MNLAGQTALVTGGAVRIGAEICRYLASERCNVVIHYDRSEAEAKNLAGELREAGVDSWAVPAHFSGGETEKAFMDAVFAEAGGISILINNASVFNKQKLVDVTEDGLLAEINANLLSPMLLTRRFAQILLNSVEGNKGYDEKRVTGKVVNMLDRRVASDEAGCIPYLVSKKALAAFTRSAAVELAPSITVNGVAPGAVLPPPGAGDDYVYDAAGEVPLGCDCTPADVAASVGFLLKSDFVTGQIVFVDGGQHLVG